MLSTTATIALLECCTNWQIDLCGIYWQCVVPDRQLELLSVPSWSADECEEELSNSKCDGSA